ncbi:hypothetical protein GWK36_09050 [Caldichromatium japonicum]|uniref:Uncharacterized protein n=1 Tax=Caldichromatium japonicum TaxID=2699430 RepID=A0A6G7VDI3_9GAMM|nr:hypothetical protein [Caldichromatium japonicum]QIK38109.1 hypothetical protein GWK36_09050 [Caldichromatium japonicum]
MRGGNEADEAQGEALEDGEMARGMLGAGTQVAVGEDDIFVSMMDAKPILAPPSAQLSVTPGT